MSVEILKPGSKGDSNFDNDDVLFGDSDDQGNDDRGNDDQGQGFLKKLPPVGLGNLDANATDGNGHALFGSGNPSTNWEIQSNSNFQLGTNIHYRTGDQILPEANDHGTLIYDAPAGPQVVDTAHGVSSAQANRGATSFDFSFSTGHGSNPETIQSFLAHGGEMLVKIDVDPTAKTDFLTLHAVYDSTLNAGGSHVVWEDKNGSVVIGDDSGNQYVTQNSQNLAFYQSLIDTNPNKPGVQTGGVSPPGQYDLVFEMLDHGNASAHGLANSDSQGNGNVVAFQHTQLNLTSPT
jgi:hypothetical protein